MKADRHVTTQAEAGGAHLQAEDTEGVRQPPKAGKAAGTDSPSAPPAGTTVLTPCRQMSGLQNCANALLLLQATRFVAFGYSSPSKLIQVPGMSQREGGGLLGPEVSLLEGNQVLAEDSD